MLSFHYKFSTSRESNDKSVGSCIATPTFFKNQKYQSGFSQKVNNISPFKSKIWNYVIYLINFRVHRLLIYPVNRSVTYCSGCSFLTCLSQFLSQSCGLWWILFQEFSKKQIFATKWIYSATTSSNDATSRRGAAINFRQKRLGLTFLLIR